VPVFATVRKGESPSAFDLVVPNGGPDAHTLSVTTLQVQGSRPDLFTIVHILRPVDEARRLAQALENSVSVGSPWAAMAPRPSRARRLRLRP